MHRGVFIGSNLYLQKNKILILGESHRNFEVEQSLYEEGPPTYETISSYISCGSKNERCYRVFDRITEIFGYDYKDNFQRRLFWNRVCYGNYISWLCRAGTNDAINYLRSQKGKNHISERTNLNDDLFKFINDNGITILFCISRLPYNNLPSLTLNEIECGDKIKICNYKAKNEHLFTNIPLKSDLKVYSVKHLSRFYSKEYINYFFNENLL